MLVHSLSKSDKVADACSFVAGCLFIIHNTIQLAWGFGINMITPKGRINELYYEKTPKNAAGHRSFMLKFYLPHLYYNWLSHQQLISFNEILDVSHAI